MEMLGFSVNLILLIVCLVMGILFLAFPIPKNYQLKNYRISLRILAAAYFVMTVLNILTLIIDSADPIPEYFNFIIMLISSLQALLITFTLIVLLNPAFVTLKRIFFNALPILVFSFIYIVFLFSAGDCIISRISDFPGCFANPATIVRLIFFLFYCFQLVYYTILFLKHHNIYQNQLENNFSDVSKVKLKWTRKAFFCALSLGIFSIGIGIFRGKIQDILFNLILIGFYFVFALKYINYNKIYSYLAPILDTPKTPASIKNTFLKPRIEWNEIKKIIINEKYFLKESITLEQMSQMLHVGRTTLSNLINSEEGIGFNTWINQMRIEEAKMLLSENPEYNLITIAELTGYSEQSNFSRVFKKITGESPSVWRRKKMVN